METVRNLKEEFLLIEKKLQEYKAIVEQLDLLDEPQRSEVIRVLWQRINEASEQLEEIIDNMNKENFPYL